MIEMRRLTHEEKQRVLGFFFTFCLFRVPTHFVRPVGGRHFTALNVFGVAALKGFPLRRRVIRLRALLAKANSFHIVSFFRHYNSVLCGMTGSALWFVVPRHSGALQTRILLFLSCGPRRSTGTAGLALATGLGRLLSLCRSLAGFSFWFFSGGRLF